MIRIPSALLFALILSCYSAPAEVTGIDDAKIAVYFSPSDPCTTAIVKALDEAKSSIRVLAYSFTSSRVAKAVVEAHKRGLSVDIILDKSQRTQNYSSADFLHNEGLAVRIDRGHTIAHNKVIVIDDRIVITGSFNFTSAAEIKNAENLLVIDSPKLAAAYLEEYEKLKGMSVVYVRKGIQD